MSKPSTKFLAAKLAVLSIAIFIAPYLVRHAYRVARPQAAFESITGRTLPPGVVATHYGSELTDNVLHVTHYWVLSGDPASLRKVTEGTEFTLSEDAILMASVMKEEFDSPLTKEDALVGYEWELDRDRWFIIFRDGTALYAH